MNPVVTVENLSKHYTLGGLHPNHITLRETLVDLVTGRSRRLRRSREDERSFWALRDVNFSVEEGETLGIVGSNGAGKSTLLKILCRIVKPTTGRARIAGRVGSLLEVGTGFHPDLTGRENIFLNGAVLGMRREEIKSKFDEIVDFSEIERHLDTQVKFYSSGMYVRLAFSVAAHLEPEILIMDEVLAVGDLAFQRKCLDKMHQVRQQGRTIFFVSHNMAAVTRLCRRALLLEHGRVTSDGAARQVVGSYVNANWNVNADRVWDESEDAPGDGVVRLRRVRVLSGGDAGAGEFPPRRGEESFAARRPVGVRITYELLRDARAPTPAIEVVNEADIKLFTSHDAEDASRDCRAGLYTSTAWIPADLLAPGTFRVHVSIESRLPNFVEHLRVRDTVAFRVVDEVGARAGGDFDGLMPGVVRPTLAWTREGGGSIAQGHTPISKARSGE